MAHALNLTDRRVLRAALIMALLLHAAALIGLHHWLAPPSLLAQLPPPFYTRVLRPQAAPESTPAPPPVHRPVPARRKPRPAAHSLAAPVAIEAETPASATESAAAPSPAPTASAPQPDAPVAGAELAASEPIGPTSAASAAITATARQTETGGDDSTLPTASGPTASAAPPPAFFDAWPPDTRLNYDLTGNYRGALHGSAQMLWQRLWDGQRTHYQTAVQLSLGLLLSMRFASQGQITDRSLAPEVYEEHVGSHQRAVRIGQDVQLNNGRRVPRPEDVQDTASQFIDLAHSLATTPALLAPGSSVHLWLARPTGVDEWVYDVLGDETLDLPRLGAVRAIHLKPRPLNRPNGSISAEIWLAPSLQYLPVRILLTQDADTSVNLLVETIDQR